MGKYDDDFGEVLYSPGGEQQPYTKTYGVARQDVEKKTQEVKRRAYDDDFGEVLYDPASSKTTQPAQTGQPRESTGDDAGRGVYTGMAQLPQMAAGALAYGADVVGAKGVRDWGLQKYQDIGEHLAKNEARTDSFTNIEDVGDLVDWQQYASGYIASQAMQGLGAGWLVKKGAQLALRKGLERLIAEKIAAEMATKGVAKEVAAATVAKEVGKNVGNTIGMGALNATQELGGIYGDAVEEAKAQGKTIDDVNKARVGVAAAGATVLDTVMDVKMLKNFLSGINVGSMPARVIKGGLYGGFREGVTETAQTGAERWGAGKDLTGPDALRDYINSAALGAHGGGLGGGAAGLRGQRSAPGIQTDPNDLSEEELPPPPPPAAVPARGTLVDPNADPVAGGAELEANAAQALQDMKPRRPGILNTVEAGQTEFAAHANAYLDQIEAEASQETGPTAEEGSKELVGNAQRALEGITPTRPAIYGIVGNAQNEAAALAPPPVAAPAVAPPPPLGKPISAAERERGIADMTPPANLVRQAAAGAGGRSSIADTIAKSQAALDRVGKVAAKRTEEAAPAEAARVAAEEAAAQAEFDAAHAQKLRSQGVAQQMSLPLPAPATTPEPASDIAAQVEAMLDPNNPKDSVFVAKGTKPPKTPKGVIKVVKPKQGLLLTTNPEKAKAVMGPNPLTDAEIAAFLGIPETKEQAFAQTPTPAVVQAKDKKGRVVAAAVTSGSGANEQAVAAQMPAGGKVEVVSAPAAQQERAAKAKKKSPPAQATAQAAPQTESKAPVEMVSLKRLKKAKEDVVEEGDDQGDEGLGYIAHVATMSDGSTYNLTQDKNEGTWLVDEKHINDDWDGDLMSAKKSEVENDLISAIEQHDLVSNEEITEYEAAAKNAPKTKAEYEAKAAEVKAKSPAVQGATTPEETPAFVAPSPTKEKTKRPKGWMPEVKQQEGADVSIKGTDHNDQPTRLDIWMSEGKVVDARLVFDDPEAKDVGIAFKPKDTVQTVLKRLQDSGEFVREGAERKDVTETKQEEKKEPLPKGTTQQTVEKDRAIRKLKKDATRLLRLDKGKVRVEIERDAPSEERSTYINEKLTPLYGENSVSLVPVPPKFSLMAEAMLRIFGKRLQFYKANNKDVSKGFEGLFVDGDPHTIYIDTTTENPAMFVLGHEFGHSLKTNHGPLFVKFVEEALPHLKNAEAKALMKKLAAEIRKENPRWSEKRVTAEVIEEMGADIIGSAFMDPAFWESLSLSAKPENRPYIARVLQELREFLKDFLAKFRTDDRLKDAQKRAAQQTPNEKLQGYLVQQYLKAPETHRLSGIIKDATLLNNAVRDLLINAYPDLTETLSNEELRAEAEAYYNEKMEPEIPWEQVPKGLQDNWVEAYDLYLSGYIAAENLHGADGRITTGLLSEYDTLTRAARAEGIVNKVTTESRARDDVKQRDDAEQVFNDMFAPKKYEDLTDEWQRDFARKVAAHRRNPSPTKLEEAGRNALTGMRRNAEKQKAFSEHLEEVREAALVLNSTEATYIAEELLSKAEKARVARAFGHKTWSGSTSTQFIEMMAEALSTPADPLGKVPASLRSLVTNNLNSSGRGDAPKFSRRMKQVATEAFRKWFGASEITKGMDPDLIREMRALDKKDDTDGLSPAERRRLDALTMMYVERDDPQVWYHGSPHDVEAFRPKMANAIYVSPSAKFAATYAVAGNADPLLTNDELPPVSVYPLFVRAENPWDYHDANHRDAVLAAMRADPRYQAEVLDKYDQTDAEFAQGLKEGRFSMVENPLAQEKIRDAGHDGFYVMETGVKNLAVYSPNQVKAAYGNDGSFSRTDDSIHRSRKGLTSTDALEHLDEGERAGMYTKKGGLKAVAAKFLSHFNALPDAKEMAAVAWAGRAKLGWYTNSVRALDEVFGVDAPRFAALLAAMSPQTSVEANLQNALSMWKNWTAKGRPTSKSAIDKLLGQSVQKADLENRPQGALSALAGKLGLPVVVDKDELVAMLRTYERASAKNKAKLLEASVLPAWINNSVRALSEPDMKLLTLSGPKVDSFYRNLIGDSYQVTNDAWMAAFAGVDQKLFAGTLTKSGPGKRPGYLSMSAKVREAADTLTKMTGEPWTPAEVQETIWAWAKTLYELQQVKGETRNARELLKDGALTDDLINATPDFRSLLNDDTKPYRQILRDAGLGAGAERLARLLGDDPEVAGRDPRAQGQASPFADRTQRGYEQAAAGRLSERFARRKRESGVKFSRRGVNIEVAPNPDEVELAERFNALTEAQKRAATYEAAQTIIPKVMTDMGLTADVEYTIGGFEGGTQPALIVKFPASVPFDTMTEAGKVLGHIFQQKAIISYDEDDKTGTQTGFVSVIPETPFSYEQQKELFSKVYAAMPEAGGFTGRDGSMVFGNFTDLPNEAFHKKMESVLASIPLDTPVESKLFTFRSEWIEPVTLEGTRYEGNKHGSEAGGEAVRRQGRIDSARAEAGEILAKHVEAAGDGGEADGTSEGVKFSRRNIAPVTEVYAIKGKEVVGMASYNGHDKVWSVWSSPTDIRNQPNLPERRHAKTEDALNALRGPGIRLIRRKDSPVTEGRDAPYGRGPDVLDLQIDNDPKPGNNLFTKTVDAAVGVINAAAGTDYSGPKARRDITRWLGNKYVDVKTLQKHIREKGGVITGAADLYRHIVLHPGATGVVMDLYERKYSDPMEEAVHSLVKNGGKLDDSNNYLIARHAKERNDVIKARTGKDAGSGMSDQKAKDVLADMATKPFFKDLQEIGKITDEIAVFKRETMLKGGVISQESHDEMAKYEHYVPLKGLDEDATGELARGFGSGTGTGFSGKGTILQYALGRTEGNLATNVIAHALLDAEAQIVRAGKNKVANSLEQLAEDFPDPKFWTVNEVKSRPRFDPETGTIKMQADNDVFADNVVISYRNGVPSRITLKEADFAAAMVKSGAAAESGILDVMRKFNGWQSQMMTTFSPIWAMVNGIRDFGTTTANILSDSRLPKGMAAAVTKGIYDIHRSGEVWKLARDPDYRGPIADKLTELKNEGGITHFYAVKSLEDRAQKLARIESDALGADKGSQMRAGLRETWKKLGGTKVADLMRDMGETVETVPRLAAYTFLTKPESEGGAGWDKARAAEYVKGLTVDFNMKGNQKFFTANFVFFNATTQSSIRLYEAMTSPRGKKVGMALMAMGFIAGLTGNSAGDDDDDGVPDYQQLPDWERSTHLILWPHGPKIPLPYGWNGFYAIGNYMADTLYGKGASHAAWQSAKAVMGSFNPMGSPDASTMRNYITKMASPSWADPVVMDALNENFFGGTIRNVSPFGSTKPPSESGKIGVSQTWKTLSRALNSLTGGSATDPGKISVNPNTFDHYFRGYLPGWPQEAQKTVASALNYGEGREFNVRTAPGVSRFVTKPPEVSYEVLNDAKENLARLDAMSKGDDADKAKLKKYTQWAGVKAVFDTNRQAISELYKEKAAVVDGKPWHGRTLTGTDKVKREEAIDDAISAHNRRMTKFYIEHSKGWPH